MGRQAGVREVPVEARLATPRRRSLRMRVVPASDVADVGHGVRKDEEAAEAVVRAIFEISSRRTGISAMDLKRIMGFGSYETAWTWLHKLRSAMVRSDSEPLGPFVEMDEALVGGRGGRTSSSF